MAGCPAICITEDKILRIEILRYVNFSVNIVGILVIFVIIACLSTGENKKDKLNKQFIYGLFSCSSYMLGEAFAWLLKGYADLIWLLRIMNDIVFLSGYLILITFTTYLLAFLSIKNSVSRIIMPIIYILCGAGILLILVNRFNGIIYTINKGGYYERGGYILVTQIISIIGIIIDTWVILKYRHQLGKNRFILMMAYTVIPLTAITIQLVVYGVPVLSVSFLLFSVLIFAGIQSQQAKQIKDQELENQEQRISVMLSQIQPHFLFNALLSVKHLCITDSDAAGEAIDNFARYLRRNIEALTSKKPIPFTDELEHVKSYLFLEKRRYKDLLQIEFDIKTTTFCIPALTVQPLVENAVRHGVSKKETAGTVRIATRETEEAYEITISDDGMGFEPNKLPNDGKVHIGIENVSQRLAMQCGGTLSYQSEIGKGTIVKVQIKK